MFCWDGPHRLSGNEVLTTRRSPGDNAAAILKSWPRTSVGAHDGVSQILSMMSLMKADQSRALIREKIVGIAVVFTALTVALPVLAQETPPAEPEGYRLENYHASTPAALKGATVIDTARALALLHGGFERRDGAVVESFTQRIRNWLARVFAFG